MLIMSRRVTLRLECMCNIMIQSMQLHDDVFCMIRWLDSYASGMYYNYQDCAWLKVNWQILAWVIPTYSIQRELGGLAWLASHSLFHEFGINCWGLLAEMRPIGSMDFLGNGKSNLAALVGCLMF